jgi:hypothetical protein
MTYIGSLSMRSLIFFTPTANIKSLVITSNLGQRKFDLINQIMIFSGITHNKKLSSLLLK